MADLPTIYDVASCAGVGIATVSRVVNGDQRVRDATRAKVLEAIRELNYRPNRAARRLAGRGENRSRVAVLLPFFTASFYFQISRAIARGLGQERIDLVLFDVASRDDKNRILDRLVTERAAEGIILVSISIGPQRRDELERLGIPVVVVDRPGTGMPSVTVENDAGGWMAASHMRACGSRSPALIAGPEKAQALMQRERAFKQVWGADAPVIRAASVEAEAGRVAVSDLLDQYSKLDGLVCVNDLLAVGALRELRNRGLRVPDQVQVIGFDDQPMMDIIDLTTVRQPVARMGDWAVRAMAGLLRSGNPVESEVLPLQIVERGTTRPST